MRYRPEVIAVAMLALAAKFTNYDLQASAASQGKPWYSSFVKTASDVMVTGILKYFVVTKVQLTNKQTSGEHSKGVSASFVVVVVVVVFKGVRVINKHLLSKKERECKVVLQLSFRAVGGKHTALTDIQEKH